jgi:hypothetical protein
MSEHFVLVSGHEVIERRPGPTITTQHETENSAGRHDLKTFLEKKFKYVVSIKSSNA